MALSVVRSCNLNREQDFTPVKPDRKRSEAGQAEHTRSATPQSLEIWSGRAPS
jgi:hypothetical protein